MHTLPKNQIDALSTNYPFDAKDQRVYGRSLRGKLFGYGALALLGVAAIAVQLIPSAPNVAAFMTTAIALASP